LDQIRTVAGYSTNDVAVRALPGNRTKFDDCVIAIDYKNITAEATFKTIRPKAAT
jgi:hypothetical protein